MSNGHDQTIIGRD